MLLDKFKFIPPEHHSGFEPKEGAVKVIKKNQFEYVDLGTIIGDAPKCMIALYDFEKKGVVRKSNPTTWRKYIAKSASKWYPNESITEHLLNELGRKLGLTMANSCIRRINNQIWFLSEYFIKEGYQLSHGADFYTLQLDDDRDFVDAIQNNNKINDQEYFNVQWVQEILSQHFPKDERALFTSFIKMLIFDGIVGNNDRHSYNWGIITSVKPNEPAIFSPIYDSARGLYWNLSENRVKYILSLTDKKGNNAKIKKYVLSLRPKIGWDGEGSINHIKLLKNIFDSEIGISKENFINLVSDENLNKCLDVINNDFCRLFSKDRHLLMTKCLTLRFAEIKQFIK